MLSVTLVPGKSFGAAETVDNSKLNLLGSPSVSLSGTASTAQIADGSVTPAKMNLTTAITVFDVLIKRPVFNPRAYAGATTQAKVQAAIDAALAEGGGTILLDEGDYSMDTPMAATADMPAGYSFLLWAYKATRAQLAFEAKRGARLLNARTTESGTPVVILGVKGALEDVIFDGVTFERTLQERVAHQTVGVLLTENGQGLKRVRFEGAHFRNVSNGIVGAAKGLKVRGCWFNYPIGHPNSNVAGQEAVGVLATTAQGASEDVLIEGCSLNGCEAGSVAPSGNPATVYGAYGLCEVKALGIRIVNNEAKRISGYGIFVRARPYGESNPSVTEEHEVTIGANKIQYEEITGQTAVTPRMGIGCFESNASIQGNRIRGAYWGIYASGGSSGWDSGNDAATRLRRVKVEGNDVALAADLKLSETGPITLLGNERFGILVEYFRRASVRNNQVNFAGRIATGLAKYWLAKGISLAVVDDAGMGGNEVWGPADTTASAADLIWQAGLQFEYCRRVEVGLNFLRNLNIGVIGASDAGNGITPADVTLDRQGMVDVVWPYAGLTRADAAAGTLTPATLHKRVRGAGYRMLKQRTSFVCDAATLGAGFVGGYVRVGSFLNGIFGRVRIWAEGGNVTMASFEVAYWNDGAVGVGEMVQTGYLTWGSQIVNKARVCVNLTPGDFICHLDVNVTALSAGTRVWVEVEGVGFNSYEGLWGAPNLPANMLGGFQATNGVGLKELTFKPGVAIADGTYNGGRLTIGAVEIWDSGAAGRTLRADPASAGDGSAI